MLRLSDSRWLHAGYGYGYSYQKICDICKKHGLPPPPPPFPVAMGSNLQKGIVLRWSAVAPMVQTGTQTNSARGYDEIVPKEAHTTSIHRKVETSLLTRYAAQDVGDGNAYRFECEKTSHTICGQTKAPCAKATISGGALAIIVKGSFTATAPPTPSLVW